MKCLICGSENVQTRDTIVSDFVMARIKPDFEPERKNYKTKLCFCKDCTFAYYDYRFTDEEENLLYRNYRDEEYQRVREKYECWYTRKINDAVNHDSVKEQQRVISKIVSQHVKHELFVALDYGGNRGETFSDEIGTREKYVFDISGVDTIEGVNRIARYEDVGCRHYDFIMCNAVFEHLSDPNEIMQRMHEIGDKDTIYYIEVPSENPFVNGNKFSIWKNLHLLLNPNYSWIRLARYFFQQKKQPFMPMKEHINFFTQKSIITMVERHGFSVIAVEENTETGALGSVTVLSVLFKMAE